MLIVIGLDILNPENVKSLQNAKRTVAETRMSLGKQDLSIQICGMIKQNES